MDWLVKFGVGGVQDFISQARKLRDVAAGSEAIGRVSREMGISAVHMGAQLVVPSVLNEESGWPNQFTVLWKGLSAEEVKNHAGCVEKCGLGAWTNFLKTGTICLKKRALRAAEGAPPAGFEHPQNQPDLYWVAAPVDVDRLYKNGYTIISDLYDGRRNTRTFDQLPDSVDGRPWACSLCGQRASVIQGSDRIRSPLALGKKERLCTVCAAKRGYALEHLARVPSTHHLACNRFFCNDRFADVRAAAEERIWDDVLDNLEMLAEKSVTAGDAGTFPEPPHIRAFAALLPHLEVLAKLSPYYALILFDGDNMGEWMRGKGICPDADEAAWRDQITGVSTALTVFCSRLEGDVARQYRGSHLLYAGGDDAFIVSPLDEFLPLIRHIHGLWEDSVFRLGPTLTLHASVIHAKTPLQPALAQARQCLTEAKHRAGRDCVSLLTDAASGAPVHWMAKWKDPVSGMPSNQFENFVLFTEQMTNWRADGGMGEEALPFSLLHTMLDGLEGFFNDRGQLALEKELGRELNRLRSRSGAVDSGSDANWRRLLDWIRHRGLRSFGDQELPVSGYEFTRSLLLATAFVARQLQWKDGMMQNSEPVTD